MTSLKVAVRVRPPSEKKCLTDPRVVADVHGRDISVTDSKARLNQPQPRVVISKLHLVDLAKSKNTAQEYCNSRIKGGGNINKSLVTLGNVISALVELWQRAKNSCPCFKQPYVPYRDSNLTWLLKESLGGNSRTLMLAAVSLSKECYIETVSTLRYSQRVKYILNRLVINERYTMKPLPEIVQLRKIMKESARRVDQLTQNWFEKWLQTYDAVLNKVLDKNIAGKSICKITEGTQNNKKQEADDETTKNQELTLSWNVILPSNEDSSTCFDFCEISNTSFLASSESVFLTDDIVSFSELKPRGDNDAGSQFVGVINKSSSLPIFEEHELNDAKFKIANEGNTTKYKNIKCTKPNSQGNSESILNICSNRIYPTPVNSFLSQSAPNIQYTFCDYSLLRQCNSTSLDMEDVTPIRLANFTEDDVSNLDEAVSFIVVAGEKVNPTDYIVASNVGADKDGQITLSEKVTIQNKSSFLSDRNVYVKNSNLRIDNACTSELREKSKENSFDTEGCSKTFNIFERENEEKPEKKKLNLYIARKDNDFVPCTETPVAELLANSTKLSNSFISDEEIPQFVKSSREFNFEQLEKQFPEKFAESRHILNCETETTKKVSAGRNKKISSVTLENDTLKIWDKSLHFNDDVNKNQTTINTISDRKLTKIQDISVLNSHTKTSSPFPEGSNKDFGTVDDTSIQIYDLSSQFFCNFSEDKPFVNKNQDPKLTDNHAFLFSDKVTEESRYLVELLKVMGDESGESSNGCCSPKRMDSELWSLLSFSSTDDPLYGSIDSFLSSNEETASLKGTENLDELDLKPLGIAKCFNKQSSCCSAVNYEHGIEFRNTTNPKKDNDFSQCENFFNNDKLEETGNSYDNEHFELLNLDEICFSTEKSDSLKVENMESKALKIQYDKRNVNDAAQEIIGFGTKNCNMVVSAENQIFPFTQDLKHTGRNLFIEKHRRSYLGVSNNINSLDFDKSDCLKSFHREFGSHNDPVNHNTRMLFECSNLKLTKENLDLLANEFLRMEKNLVKDNISNLNNNILDNSNSVHITTLSSSDTCNTHDEAFQQEPFQRIKPVESDIDSLRNVEARSFDSSFHTSNIHELSENNMQYSLNNAHYENSITSSCLSVNQENQSKLITTSDVDTPVLVNDTTDTNKAFFNLGQQIDAQYRSLSEEDVTFPPKSNSDENTKDKSQYMKCDYFKLADKIVTVPQKSHLLSSVRRSWPQFSKIESALETTKLDERVKSWDWEFSNDTDDKLKASDQTQLSSNKETIVNEAKSYLWTSVNNNKSKFSENEVLEYEIINDFVQKQLSSNTETIVNDAKSYTWTSVNNNNSEFTENEVLKDERIQGYVQKQLSSNTETIVNDVKSYPWTSVNNNNFEISDNEVVKDEINGYVRNDVFIDYTRFVGPNTSLTPIVEEEDKDSKVSEKSKTEDQNYNSFMPDSLENPEIEMTLWANKYLKEYRSQSISISKLENPQVNQFLANQCQINPEDADTNTNNTQNVSNLNSTFEVAKIVNLPEDDYEFWDSSKSSSSSDSITYVFVSKEQKYVPDETFSATNSLYSSLLSSVSLDSLEKTAIQPKVSGMSPRTLSIDSLIAEEILFQLRNGDSMSKNCFELNENSADQNNEIDQKAAFSNFKNRALVWPSDTVGIPTQFNGNITENNCTSSSATSNCSLKSENNTKNHTQFLFNYHKRKPADKTNGSPFEIANNNLTEARKNTLNFEINRNVMPFENSNMKSFTPKYCFENSDYVHVDENVDTVHDSHERVRKKNEKYLPGTVCDHFACRFTKNCIDSSQRNSIFVPPSSSSSYQKKKLSTSPVQIEEHCPLLEARVMFCKSTQTENVSSRMFSDDMIKTEANSPDSLALMMRSMDLIAETLNYLKDERNRVPQCCKKIKKPKRQIKQRLNFDNESIIGQHKEKYISASTDDEWKRISSEKAQNSEGKFIYSASKDKKNLISSFSNNPKNKSSHESVEENEQEQKLCNGKKVTHRTMEKKHRSYTLPFDCRKQKLDYELLLDGVKSPHTNVLNLKSSALSKERVSNSCPEPQISEEMSICLLRSSSPNSNSLKKERISPTLKTHTVSDNPKNSPKEYLKYLTEIRRQIIEVTKQSQNNNDQRNHQDVSSSKNCSKNPLKDLRKESRTIFLSPNKVSSSSSEGYLSSVCSGGVYRPFSDSSTDSDCSSTILSDPTTLEAPTLCRRKVSQLEFKAQRMNQLRVSPSTRWHNTSADSGAFFMDSPRTEKKDFLGSSRCQRRSDLIILNHTQNKEKSLLSEKKTLRQKVDVSDLKVNNRSATSDESQTIEQPSSSSSNFKLLQRVPSQNHCKSLHVPENQALGFQDLNTIGDEYLYISQTLGNSNEPTSSRINCKPQPALPSKKACFGNLQNKSITKTAPDKRILVDRSDIEILLASIETDKAFLRRRRNPILDRSYSPSLTVLTSTSSTEREDLFSYDSYKCLPDPVLYLSSDSNGVSVC